MVRISPSLQGKYALSLVLVLRSHMPPGKKEKNKTKQKQYCNKFNKDLKNGPHQKKRRRRKKKSGNGEERGREGWPNSRGFACKAKSPMRYSYSRETKELLRVRLYKIYYYGI